LAGLAQTGLLHSPLPLPRVVEGMPLAAAWSADDEANIVIEDLEEDGLYNNARVVDTKALLEPLPEGDAEIGQLLRLWGVMGAEVNADCAELQVGDLRCLSLRGTLDKLEFFDRPALLTIRHDGIKQQVLLSALGEDNATLTGAHGTRRIDRERLERLWTGKFDMVWRCNTDSAYIFGGMFGNPVVWLRRRLTLVAGSKWDSRMGPESPFFDDTLEARVRNFQLMHGLKPDGIAGPRTQIMLNALAPEPSIPTLAVETDESQ